jgi:hypothetical protein
MSNPRALAAGLVAAVVAPILSWSAAAGGNPVFSTVDPPDVTRRANSGTRAIFINGRGEMAGYYEIAGGSGALNGFLREADGTFQSFAAPDGSTDIYVHALNDRGTILGSYVGKDLRTHGFLRKRNGGLTAIDVPGARETLAYAINSRGTVAGTADGSGFVMTARGAVSTFRPQGAVTTVACGLNDAGEVGGVYFDSNEVAHGFKRSPNGDITVFDAPGSAKTFASSISGSGDIGGYFVDGSHVMHGYVRHNDGSFAAADLPNAQEISVGNLREGNAAGSFREAGNRHGFIREASGTMIRIDFPGARYSMLSQLGPRGSAVGTYYDSHNVSHGFLLRRPATQD